MVDTVQSSLRGVAFTTPTPFSDNGREILHSKLAETLNTIINAGGKTLIPCGNTGEYYSLSDTERVNVVETTVNTVDSDGVIIGGVSGNISQAIDLINEYEAVGVDGIMIHDPNHTYIHQEGLKEYYTRLAEATDLGIVLYKRGPALSNSVISELTTVDNIVGLKYAVNDINKFAELNKMIDDDFVLTNGIAERFAPSFALEGAEGFTTGIGSVFPKVSLALRDAIEAKNWARAVEIRDLVRPYENIRDEPGLNNDIGSANNVPAVKYGLELAGRYGGPVREPLTGLSDPDKRRVEECYQSLTEFVNNI